MGIADLYKVIATETGGKYPIESHMSRFTGLRFAVDISIFLYKYIRSSGPIAWKNSFILLLITLKRHGIRSVCIFDGPNPPIEKLRTQEKRREENEKALTRLSECRKMREKLQKKYLFSEEEMPKGVSEACQILIGKPRKLTEIDYTCAGECSEALGDVIRRLEFSTMPITADHADEAIKIVEMLGFPALTAEGEAEALCASLAVYGHVDAVLTEDTDVLAYGVPMMVAFKDFKLGDEKLWCIPLNAMLQDMDLKRNEFRDLCILLSCDYNERVKGYPPDGKNRKTPVSIGAVHAMTMIRKYRVLEEVVKHVIIDGPLKYQRCRELFTPLRDLPRGYVPQNRPIDFRALSNLLQEGGVTISMDYIQQFFRPVTVNFADDDDDDE